MREDFRHAVRALTRRRRFAALAAAVLGAGISLNVALFSITYPVLANHLPVAGSHELLSIYMTPPKQPDRARTLHPDVFSALQRNNDVFVDVTMHWSTPFVMRVDDRVEEVTGERVLSNYFKVLGVAPALGRTLLPEEDAPSNPSKAVVISHRLWTRRFGGDASIIGKDLGLTFPWASNADRATVVGVMPPDFRGVSESWKPTDLWISFAQASDGRQMRASGVAIGRLKPDLTPRQAADRVKSLASEASREVFRPGTEPGFVVLQTADIRVPSNPLASVVPARLALGVLLVGLAVLLVAASNIAGVLLARGVERSGEMAIRRIVGASGSRIARLVVFEGLILCFMGGAVGLILAPWALGAFRAVIPEQLGLEARVNSAAVLFTVGVCAAVGVLIGLLPARQALRRDLFCVGTGSHQGISTRGKRLRHLVTVPQVACSMGLLIVAGAQARELLRLETSNLGYEPRNLIVANPYLVNGNIAEASGTPPAAEERSAARNRLFYEKLLAAVQRLPGVADAAISSRLPLEATGNPAVLVGRPDATYTDGSGAAVADRVALSPGYFRTMGLTLVSGRDFDERERLGSLQVVILSRSISERLFPQGDALGSTITVANAWNTRGQKASYAVVGVVSDVRSVLQSETVQPMIYVPLGQEWSPASSNVLVRMAREASASMPDLKNAIAKADPMAEVRRIRAMSHIVDELLYPRRLAAGILVASAAASILLTIVGVYGVISYSVAQRSSEIGLRLALGASQSAIRKLVLGEAAVVAVIGATLGALVALSTVRLISSRFSAVSTPDVPTSLLAILAVILLVLVSSYIPVRRTMSFDPAKTLRNV